MSTTPIEPNSVPDIWLEFTISTPPLLSPPCSFPHFSSLPTELRLQIYDMSLLPRTITIACLRSSSMSHTCADSLLPPLSRPPRLGAPPPPALLHVSRESRNEVARKHYTPLFGVSVSRIHARVPYKAPP